jgi:lectin, mannose-binding 2
MALESSPPHCCQLYHRGRIQSALHLFFYPDIPLFIVRQISGSTGHLHGDGLALWITSERAQPGPVFGSKGKQHTLSSPATEVYEYNLQIISLESGSSSIRAHFCTHIQRVGTYCVSRCRYKNDLESDYPFPRIVAMQGDGKTSYDVGKDGVPTMIGECTVRADVF